MISYSDPLWLPLKGEDATALASAAARAADLPSPSGEGARMGS
jgi:hypothetical protein